MLQLKVSIEDDKNKNIDELTTELEHQNELCAAYREKLLSFINIVEEQTEEMSTGIQIIIDNIRRADSEMQKYPQD